MKIAYFDCAAGIAGDMMLGALVEAGVPLVYLRQVLSALPFRRYVLTAQKVSRGGLAGTRVSLTLKSGRPLPFDERTSLARPGHGYPWTKIDGLLGQSRLPAKVKDQSRLIFRKLAAAEAKAHGVSLQQVHFHELAAVDTVFEVVGAVAGLKYLKIGRIFASPLPLGGGWIKTAHGRLPLPAPATANLLAAVKAPAYQDGRQGELITPTGAAIITALAEGFGPMPEAEYQKVGCGAGRREEKKYPNLLRLFVGEEERSTVSGAEFMIEANIDDMNPQFYEYLIDVLLKLGAYDVFLAPVIMKKERWGTLLSVLTPARVLPKISHQIFQETTTFGLRTYPVNRQKLDRRLVTVKTKYGLVRVKLGFWRGKIVDRSPEYADCRRQAAAKKVPLREVYRQAQQAAWGKGTNSKRGQLLIAAEENSEATV